MSFRNGNSGASLMELSSAGNLGIGAMPEAYHSDYKAIDINNSASVMGYTGNNGAWLLENLYFGTDGNWKHKNSDFSALVEMYDGVFNVYNTASGTAGATATLQNRLKIDQSGKVGIGETAPDKQLHIKNTATGDTGIVIENTNNAQNLDIDFYNNSGAAQGRIRYAEGAGSFGFAPNVSATDALHILNDGKVGIGTDSPAHPLSVQAASAKITACSTGDSQVIGF